MRPTIESARHLVCEMQGGEAPGLTSSNWEKRWLPWNLVFNLELVRAA